MTSDRREFKVQSTEQKFVIPLILVTSLFFLWGLAYGLLDVLNKHFQETLHIDKSKSALLQMAYFGAYFLVAVPAGIFMNRYGYKKGIILGLLLYAAGAFLFYPSAQISSFQFFLFSLFILASGLAFLETAANPYITVLGSPVKSEFRLNLSQSFNGVGSFLGPLIGAQLFFTNQEGGDGDLASVQWVYIVIAFIVLLVAGLFWRTPLPEIQESNLVSEEGLDNSGLLQHRNFTGAVVAQFFYVAAQVGIAAFFINYCTESGLEIDSARAAYLLSTGLLLFTIGRFVGTTLMRWIAPNKLLLIYAILNIILCLIVLSQQGQWSVYALIAIFFFESIMFPTIFALGVKDLGHHTKRASSILIMSIVGGALAPFAMGLIADNHHTAFSYIIPLCCFFVVAWYGWRGYKIISD